MKAEPAGPLLLPCFSFVCPQGALSAPGALGQLWVAAWAFQNLPMVLGKDLEHPWGAELLARGHSWPSPPRAHRGLSLPTACFQINRSGWTLRPGPPPTVRQELGDGWPSSGLWFILQDPPGARVALTAILGGRSPQLKYGDPCDQPPRGPSLRFQGALPRGRRRRGSAGHHSAPEGQAPPSGGSIGGGASPAQGPSRDALGTGGGRCVGRLRSGV